MEPDRQSLLYHQKHYNSAVMEGYIFFHLSKDGFTLFPPNMSAASAAKTDYYIIDVQ